MGRKIRAAVLLSFCFLLTGCSSVNSDSKEAQITQEVTEQTQEIVEQNQKVTEQSQEVAQTVTYLAEDYGEIQEYGSEFYYEEDVMGFFYNMECFYLNSDFLYTMNDTLEKFYDEYLRQYQETENWYMEEGKQELPPGKVPYSELRFLEVRYVDNDYVSLLFDDVTYMGGANSYSMYDAVTLDRHTGEEVTAAEILQEDDSRLLNTVVELMGLEGEADWKDIDFYLQEDKIVFFYRMPGIWEEVVLGR